MSGSTRPRLAFSVAGVPISEAVRLDYIKPLDQNKNEANGPLLLFASGGAARIDGFDIRQVVFDHV